ncbi:MAG: hypothetical protein KA746_15310 [Pyrinomonadaceae bacterium]|nr:hypothetical protein [Pyrinomonadaceae bacterium]MBP6213478.1 hypothetical protein [Pyrinomonadaceae bacterium]
MGEPLSYSLFFIEASPYFPKGALVELTDIGECFLPDRGDGQPDKLDRTTLKRCPPFAENVPPGQCPVHVTSIDPIFGDEKDVAVDQTSHWQVIIVPIPDSAAPLSAVAVTDRLREFETERFESPSVEIIDGREVYRLHIAWLRPGFYSAKFEFADGSVAAITFIKLFPKHFSDRFSELPEPAGTDIPHVPIPAQPNAPLGRSDIFSDKLLNTALELTTEWGENFCKPIHERIRRTYPTLTDAEIDELTKLSREAESYIYRLAEQELAGSFSEDQIVPEARRKFNWLSLDNASRLKNIGMFYARK